MPIISEEQYKKTEMIVNEFTKPGGIGEKLQNILIQTADDKDNWVIETFHYTTTVL
jgi:carnitine O-acetyltransferase